MLNQEKIEAYDCKHITMLQTDTVGHRLATVLLCGPHPDPARFQRIKKFGVRLKIKYLTAELTKVLYFAVIFIFGLHGSALRM